MLGGPRLPLKDAIQRYLFKLNHLVLSPRAATGEELKMNMLRVWRRRRASQGVATSPATRRVKVTAAVIAPMLLAALLGAAPAPADAASVPSCALDWREDGRREVGTLDLRQLEVTYRFEVYCTAVHTSMGASSVTLALYSHGANGSRPSQSKTLRACSGSTPDCNPVSGEPNGNFIRVGFTEKMYVNIGSCNSRVRYLSGIIERWAGRSYSVLSTELEPRSDAVFTTTGARVATTQVCFSKGSPSLWLARNMTNAGRPRPTPEHQAHHIVANNHPGAAATKKLLWNTFKLGINAEANGAWVLPAHHRQIHKSQTRYYDYVHAKLVAESRKGKQTWRARKVLRAIAVDLEAGRTPWE